MDHIYHMDFHWGNFKPSWPTNPQLSMNKWYNIGHPQHQGTAAPTFDAQRLVLRAGYVVPFLKELISARKLSAICLGLSALEMPARPRAPENQRRSKKNRTVDRRSCDRMIHNEVMLAFCRAIFLGRVMDKHRLVAQSNLLWVIPILGPGWVATYVWPIFGWVETHRASNMHATAPKFLVYHIQVNVKDLPCYLSKCTISLCSPMIIHISHLAVSENAVYLKVVMFITFFIRKMWTNDHV